MPYEHLPNVSLDSTSLGLAFKFPGEGWGCGGAEKVFRRHFLLVPIFSLFELFSSWLGFRLPPPLFHSESGGEGLFPVGGNRRGV
ncbi:hypothetical protein JTE90_011358 [Oedothorax gibbosus]|uniref:Uncharacterized protein n=1 Tax=Oedothorax gibbosus TaxID=931172 RepID=A0AAV6VLV7_9ARAC|nr:hypothetical protein JTE90_011358 [Oedothorax gibbosus]